MPDGMFLPLFTVITKLHHFTLTIKYHHRLKDRYCDSDAEEGRDTGPAQCGI